jgi:hypothetical protein
VDADAARRSAKARERIALLELDAQDGSAGVDDADVLSLDRRISACLRRVVAVACWYALPPPPCRVYMAGMTPYAAPCVHSRLARRCLRLRAFAGRYLVAAARRGNRCAPLKLLFCALPCLFTGILLVASVLAAHAASLLH